MGSSPIYIATERHTLPRDTDQNHQLDLVQLKAFLHAFSSENKNLSAVLAEKGVSH